MAKITAVELGADICAFARTDVRRGKEVRLSDAEILDPAAFPGIEAFTMAVIDLIEDAPEVTVIEPADEKTA